MHIKIEMHELEAHTVWIIFAAGFYVLKWLHQGFQCILLLFPLSFFGLQVAVRPYPKLSWIAIAIGDAGGLNV